MIKRSKVFKIHDDLYIISQSFSKEGLYYTDGLAIKTSLSASYKRIGGMVMESFQAFRFDVSESDIRKSDSYGNKSIEKLFDRKKEFVANVQCCSLELEVGESIISIYPEIMQKNAIPKETGKMLEVHVDPLE